MKTKIKKEDSKKLSLDDLKVQSFVTSFSIEEGGTQHLYGGRSTSLEPSRNTCTCHKGCPTNHACHVE